ncbi:hypothetical protein DFH09DRAFT_1136778 [Mycena vulgaris]|nr:hypothetical protein DFH09DRAFT_1136778 [Mycena vulgaris]
MPAAAEDEFTRDVVEGRRGAPVLLAARGLGGGVLWRGVWDDGNDVYVERGYELREGRGIQQRMQTQPRAPRTPSTPWSSPSSATCPALDRLLKNQRCAIPLRGVSLRSGGAALLRVAATTMSSSRVGAPLRRGRASLLRCDVPAVAARRPDVCARVALRYRCVESWARCYCLRCHCVAAAARRLRQRV